MSALKDNAETGKTYMSILELSHDEAKAFFLKAESYCNFDLPPYFVFDQLLSGIDNFLNKKNFQTVRRLAREILMT